MAGEGTRYGTEVKEKTIEGIREGVVERRQWKRLEKEDMLGLYRELTEGLREVM